MNVPSPARGSAAGVPVRPPRARARPGVGVDVVHVPRLAARLAEQPGLADALFTPAERRAAERGPAAAADLALGFAAKEALLKALGRGLVATGPDAALLEIEVQVEGPRARLALTGTVAAAVARRGAARPVLSLARAGAHALATVLLVPAAGSRGRPTA